MKENWTCESDVHFKSKFVLVSNETYSNNVFNFGCINYLIYDNEYLIGVWKIKEKNIAN